jgi:hypothetical protein
MAYLLPLNTVRYRVLGRTAWGRGHLDRWGDRVVARVLGRYFGDEQHDIGRLHVEQAPAGQGVRPPSSV